MLAASYEAKAHGVRTAMGGVQARRLCPRVVVVPPRMGEYAKASKAVFEVFRQTTPLVEGLSIDEAFLDVGGLGKVSGTPTEIALRLRGEVRERVGLPITVGVARTKFLAKVASGVAKPDGLLVVPPDGELDFLHPLPVERLWGSGRSPPTSSAATGSAPWARWPGSASRPWWPWSARRRAGTCTPWPTTATRARWTPAAGDARSVPARPRPLPSRPPTWTRW